MPRFNTVHSVREAVSDLAEHMSLTEGQVDDIVHDLEIHVRTVVDQECGTLQENRELGLRILKRLGVSPHGPMLSY